jgi:hypothetical protein
MIPANVEQLFDVTQDPQAKQRLLSGQSNHARCPYCGYQGRLATPIIYHDNEKELLLTFFPPELAMPINEQEKIIGPHIKSVMDKLPAEKRKAYLLKPQANLTYDSMIQTILSKDGITPEMMRAQQERVMLVERLIQVTSKDVRSELIRQNEGIIDEQFFALFSRLAQSAMSSGQEPIARAMVELQKQLLDETATGRQLQESVKELEAVQKTLQEVSQNQSLTREKLLELVLENPTDARLRAFVSMTRNGMDYTFFQLLTEKIEKASGDEKAKLEAARDKLLSDISEMDKQLEARFKAAQEFIEGLLAQEDVEKAVRENLDGFSQDTVELAQTMLRQASEKNDYARMGKLQKMIQVLQQASTPPEIAFIEQLLDLPDEATIEQVLTQNIDVLSDEFMQALSGLVAQMDGAASQGSKEAESILEKLQMVYQVALRISMKKQMG